MSKNGWRATTQRWSNKWAIDIDAVAQQQAADDREAGRNLIETLSEWRADTIANAITSTASATAPTADVEPADFVSMIFSQLWNERRIDRLADFFDFRIGAHLTAGRDLYGVLEYEEYLSALFTAIPDLTLSVDHVADVPYLGEARDMAVRWSMAGVHKGDGIFGPASGAPIYVLGMTQWRVMNGRVREEWTVFDELALRRQIETHRLL